MVRCSTIYDKTINKKIFLVRGDESYTHTTTTLIELTNLDTTQYAYFTATFNINVLRDSGSSKIAIYDNDALLDVLDWSSASTGTTYSCNLTWDVEHNIYAKYMGNKQCLMSTSKKILLNEIDEKVYPTTLTASASAAHYNTGKNITITGNLTCETVPAVVGNKTINLYVDNTLVDTVTTSVTGAFSSTFNLGEREGQVKVDVVFNGANTVRRSMGSCYANIGYELTVYQMPKVVLLPYDNVFVARLAKPTDNGFVPVANKTISFYISNVEPTTLYATTNSEGLATFHTGSDSGYQPPSPTMEYCGFAYSEESVDYENDFEVLSYLPANYTFTTDKNIISPATQANLKVVFKGSVPDIPITLIKGEYSSDYPQSAVLAELKTDNSGEINYTYMGSGAGATSIHAILGQYSHATVELEDVIQYWSKSNKSELNRSYNLEGGSLIPQSNGYSLSRTDNKQPWTSVILDDNILTPTNLAVEFDVISVSNPQLKLYVAGSTFRGYIHLPFTGFSHVRMEGGADNVVKIYLDGLLRSTVPYSRFARNFGFGFFDGELGDRIVFDNVKYEVL